VGREDSIDDDDDHDHDHDDDDDVSVFFQKTIIESLLGIVLIAEKLAA
jgi:hypothetical protein